MKKKLMALLLSCLLVISAVPSSALAEDSSDAVSLSGDYIEGEAIVCMDAPASGMLRRSAVPELLAGAEVLMTVSDGQEEEAASPQTYGLRAAAQPQGQVLALVRDSSRTTAELIAELEAYDQVVFAEPNYQVEEYIDDSALAEGLTEALSTVGEAAAPETTPEANDEDLSLKEENTAQTEDESQKIDAEADESTDEAPARVITDNMVNRKALNMTDYQWGFDNIGQFGGESGFDVNYDAWNNQNTAASNTDPVVAVFDSGVDVNNPDLTGKMWTKPADVNLPGGAHGYNPSGDDDTDINDDESGHGTHCAGIIGAEWNDFGVSGIGKDTQIMVVKRPDDTAGILKGYDYMVQACEADVNLRVVSNSWGIAGQSQSLSRAVQTLGEAGAISVFASGNSDLDIDNTSFMATALKDNPYAVIVDSTDYQGRRSGFSCYGQRTTDVMAPGSRVLSTFHQNQSTDEGLVSAEQYYAEFDAKRLFYENFEDKDNYWQFSDTQWVNSSESYYDGPGCLKTDVSKEVKWILSEPLDLSALVKADQSEKRYFSARAAVLENENVDAAAIAAVSVQTVDGEWASIGSQAAGVYGGWAAFSGELPANTDYEHFTVQIAVVTGKINAHHGSMKLDPQPGTVVLDSFGIGSDAQPYIYMDGTSMACPAAAGAAAVMASQYPDQTAENLAARLVGSVKRSNDFTDLCVSGGQIDLSAASDPYPVINRASEDGNTVTVEGYFFGNSPTVTLGGTAAAVKDTKTEDDGKTILIVDKPEGFAGGMTQVVVDNSGKTGQDHFALGARTDRVYYDQTSLPLPEDEAFYTMDNGHLVGYDGSLYYLPTGNLISGTTTDMIWRYSPEKQSWSTVALPAQVTSITATTWNGKLLVNGTDLTTNQNYFALYDGSSWQQLEYGEDQTAALNKVLLPGMGGDGSRVLLFGGFDMSTNSDASTVYELNVESGALTDTGITLKTGRTRPQVAYQNGEYLVSGGIASAWNLGAVQDVELVAADGSTRIIEQPGVTQEQQYGFAGSAVKGGYLLAGGINQADTADTYTLSSGGTALEVYGKRAADSALITPAATAYRGHFYVLAGSNTNEAHRVFAATAVDTVDQPGDKISGGGTTDPTGDGGSTAKAAGVNTGITGQPQYAALLSLALLALLLGGCAVYRKRMN
ncbi:S8 family serine peptidase [Eubacterium sp. 1001713B170207_170306_E7]|uniref:S8 family serine peptidase n=1 Tax=Eubacterium sp. 1001713B170207_170306_E7 TaxID=2787097 RepID=UPI001897CF8C|nr:S8 family serine peptidase [Eubacterium sp. 1001713B170207_170306_E7]